MAALPRFLRVLSIEAGEVSFPKNCKNKALLVSVWREEE